MRFPNSLEVVLLFGLPGSGKLTQAKLLCGQNTAILHQEMSRLLDGGKKDGGLCSNDMVAHLTDIFFEQKVVSGAQIILDGFVRNMIQGHHVVQLFEGIRRKGVLVKVTAIELVVRDEVADGRMLERAQAPGSLRTNELDSDVRKRRIETHHRDILQIKDVMLGLVNWHLVPEAPIETVRVDIVEILKFEGIRF